MNQSDDARLEAGGRAAVYGILARLFERELDEEAVHSLGEPADAVWSALRTLGVDPRAIDRLRREAGATSEALVDLAVEYAQLFEAHDRVYPFASCWVAGAKPLLLGPPAAAAYDFYVEAGVGLDSEHAYRADHIGTELAFLALLAGRTADSDDDESAAHLERYARFMEEIILPWAPAFMDAVASDPRADFYAALARIAREFILFDAASLRPSPTGGAAAG